MWRWMRILTIVWIEHKQIRKYWNLCKKDHYGQHWHKDRRNGRHMWCVTTHYWRRSLNDWRLNGRKENCCETKGNFARLVEKNKQNGLKRKLGNRTDRRRWSRICPFGNTSKVKVEEEEKDEETVMEHVQVSWSTVGFHSREAGTATVHGERAKFHWRQRATGVSLDACWQDLQTSLVSRPTNTLSSLWIEPRQTVTYRSWFTVQHMTVNRRWLQYIVFAVT